MKRGHVICLYYYFNIVKMAVSTVEMAAAICMPPPVLFDRLKGPVTSLPFFQQTFRSFQLSDKTQNTSVLLNG